MFSGENSGLGKIPGWFMALKRAGIKAEMHIYTEGGHGYGLAHTGNAIRNRGMLAADWLKCQI